MNDLRNTASSVVCPICQGQEFVDFNRRANAMCAACKSFERTRLAWIVMNRLINNFASRKIVHFAPERGIASNLNRICGDGYKAFDFDPSRYPIDSVKVTRLDLCQPIDAIPPDSQDLVLHNHVLEHLPCNPWRALHRMDSLLKKGGYHIFSLPIIREHYKEDLDPSMPDSERIANFGQNDHMRMFGRHDARQMIADEFGRDAYFTSYVDIEESELERAGIPISVLATVSSHSVFVNIRG